MRCGNGVRRRRRGGTSDRLNRGSSRSVESSERLSAKTPWAIDCSHSLRDQARPPRTDYHRGVTRRAIAAALTPLRDDGARVDLEAIPPYVGFLAAGGVNGVLARLNR